MSDQEFQHRFREGPIIFKHFLPEQAFNYTNCMKNIIAFLHKVDAVCTQIDESDAAGRESLPNKVSEICGMVEGIKKCLVLIHREIVRLEGIESACLGGGDPPRQTCDDFNTLGDNL